MWIIGSILAITFLIAFPRISAGVILISVLSVLFGKWSQRFKTILKFSILAKVIFEELGKKIFIFKFVDRIINFVTNITFLSKILKNPYNIRFDYLIVISVFLTLIDILIMKIYCIITHSQLNTTTHKKKDNVFDKFINILKTGIISKYKQLKSKKKVNEFKNQNVEQDEENMFKNLVFTKYSNSEEKTTN